MKTKTKRVVGFCGLCGVAAVTTIAAIMPAPGVSATDVSSVTDQISVRVVSDTPDVSVDGLEDGSQTVSPNLQFDINYSAGVDTVEVKITYTDENGETHTKIIDNFQPDYTEGTRPESIDLRGMIADDDTPFGYGNYVLEVIGTGYAGVQDEEIIEFSYLPVVITETGTDTLGNVTVKVETDSAPEGEVTETEINVYDKDGNLVYGPITVPINPDGTAPEIEIPFAELGLPSDDYTLVGQGKDADGNNVGDPYELIISYREKEITTDEIGDAYVDVVFPDGATTAIITVTDESGKEVLVPITVDNPTGSGPTTVKVKLPFASEGGLPNGPYFINIDFYGPSGVIMPAYSARMKYNYGAHKDIPVPDTGGMMGSLNLANQDFVITGIIIFSIVAISGVAVLMKGRKKTTTRRRK